MSEWHSMQNAVEIAMETVKVAVAAERARCLRVVQRLRGRKQDGPLTLHAVAGLLNDIERGIDSGEEP